MSQAFEKLKQEFLGETEETLASFRSDLLLLGETPFASLPDPKLIDKIFRTAHSLKGVLGMFGMEEMARVSHAMESVLDRIRAGSLVVDKSLVDLLLEGNETLHTLLSRAKSTPGENDPSADALIRRIEAFLALENQDKAPRPKNDPLALALAQLSATEAGAIRSAFESGDSVAVIENAAQGETAGRSFYEVVRCARAWGVIHGFVEGPQQEPPRPPTLRILVSGKGGIFALAKAVGLHGGEVLVCEPDRVLQSAPDPAPSVPRAPTSPREAPETSVGTTLRVRLERIDRLLASLAELLQAKMALDESAAQVFGAPFHRMRRTELMQSLRSLGHKISSLQEEILEVRLVSLGTLVPKLERVVWSAAKECNKRVRLARSGMDVEVDKEVVDALLGPLVHLMRNAVDHGIEDEPTRAQRGKEPAGTIRIQARSNGSVATVEVSDDGGGIDLNRVLEIGRQRGLLPRDREPHKNEIVDVLFHPGFTTRGEATSLSGRGVGLDAVRDAVLNLGGEMEVETGSSGTLVRLRVPTRVAFLSALLVRAGGETFVLPVASVTEVVKIHPHEVENTGEGEAALLGEKKVPVVDLGQAMGLSPVDRNRERLIALLLSSSGKSALLLVDGVGARRDVVTQGLGIVRSSIAGVVGSTELGDGKTLLLLDPSALLDPGLRGAKAEELHDRNLLDR
jgi:two-component system chemotaxis sensor kinase CheA